MKAPRKGSLEDKLANTVLPDTQLPFVNNDPFGNDYLGTLSDINEEFAGGDPVVEGGGLDDTNTLTIQEMDLGVKKDWKTRTNRRGSGPDSISLKNEYDDAVVVNTSSNVLQKYRNYHSTAYTEAAKAEAAKIAKAHETDPVFRERDAKLKIAESISLTALNTELLNQIKSGIADLLFELKDFKRKKTEDEYIEGQEVVLIHSMTADDGVVRIDFTDLSSFIGPADIKRDIQNFPSKKIFSLSLQVVSGGNLWYATNQEDHNRTFSKLTNGVREITATKPTFESLNFRVDANTDIIITGTY